MRAYDHTDPLSIFQFSHKLIHRTLQEAVALLDSEGCIESPKDKGKGRLGNLVEKYFFGYEPNSSPLADFPEAGVELKVTPLKEIGNGKLTVKERLVCDMIDYMEIVKEEFEDSRFYKKSILMLIIFYLHIKGYPVTDLRFLYSVLWKIKDKDLMIIKQDFLTIREKVRQGKAHELSEGDTFYLGAVRKGQKGQNPRKQPFNSIPAKARAFSLKTSYMRSILDFVQKSGKDAASNLTDKELPGIEMATSADLQRHTLDQVLLGHYAQYIGKDYKEIAQSMGIAICKEDKSKYANIVRKIFSQLEKSEEIKKSGIKIKTIRLEANGSIKESMAFKQIDYQEILDTEDWEDSAWYDIVTNRYLFIVFRRQDDESWGNEPRYVLDKMFFWTMPTEDLSVAEEYWYNIRENVLKDTLQDSNNTYWRLKDQRNFHVRPKAVNAKDTTFSPISREVVPKKCYWFNRQYVLEVIKRAYGQDWDRLFKK